MPSIFGLVQDGLSWLPAALLPALLDQSNGTCLRGKYSRAKILELFLHLWLYEVQASHSQCVRPPHKHCIWTAIMLIAGVLALVAQAGLAAAKLSQLPAL